MLTFFKLKSKIKKYTNVLEQNTSKYLIIEFSDNALKKKNQNHLSDCDLFGDIGLLF